jgi:hypothetical protein
MARPGKAPDPELTRLLEPELSLPASARIWSYANREKPIGPYSEGRIRALIGHGEIRADTLLWRQGMPEWARAAEVAEFAALLRR